MNENLRLTVENPSSGFVEDMAEIAVEAVRKAATKLVSDYFGPAADSEEARYQLILTDRIVDRACRSSHNDPHQVPPRSKNAD